jgi:hypothetical protein
MRKLFLRLATLAGVVITLAACADSPTQSEQPQSAPALEPAGPVQDTQVQGCVLEGFCVLEPVSPAPCDPWEDLNWCEGDGGSCITSVFQPTDPTVQSCPGDGGGGGGLLPPPPPPDDGTSLDEATATCAEPPAPECEDCNPPEEESTICPQPFVGNVLPTLINIAGRNHEFQFTGTLSYPLRRLTGGASPATYQIGLPETSKDTWWIAESGTIQVMCRGAWISRRLWVGQLYVVGSDLHMVMGPGHPDF